MTGPVEIMRSARPPWQAASPWLWPRRYRPRGLWGLSATATRGVPVRAFVMDVHASGAVTTHEVGRIWGRDGREYRQKFISDGVHAGYIQAEISRFAGGGKPLTRHEISDGGGGGGVYITPGGPGDISMGPPSPGGFGVSVTPGSYGDISLGRMAHAGQAAAPIAVDLLDSDGVIVSVAAVDPNFWAANATQATAYAQQHGFDFYVPGGPPGPTEAERGVASMGDVQNWVASQNVGVATPTSPCAVESKAPCTLTDAACVAMHGSGWSAVHEQCVQSWSADGTTPTMGPCDWCKSSTTNQIVAGLIVYLPAAAIVAGFAHIGFGLAMMPSLAIGLTVPLVLTWAFDQAFGGTM